MSFAPTYLEFARALDDKNNYVCLSFTCDCDAGVSAGATSPLISGGYGEYSYGGAHGARQMIIAHDLNETLSLS